MITLLSAALIWTGTSAMAQDGPPPRDPPSTMPTEGQGVINPNDKAAIDAHMGQQVHIQGVIESAEWSRSGKVMNIAFKDSADTKLGVVLFQASQKKFDEAFNGDFAKAIAGAVVRINGKLEEYGGRDEKLKGTPQIILKSPSQVTIMEPATTQKE